MSIDLTKISSEVLSRESLEKQLKIPWGRFYLIGALIKNGWPLPMDSNEFDLFVEWDKIINDAPPIAMDDGSDNMHDCALAIADGFASEYVDEWFVNQSNEKRKLEIDLFQRMLMQYFYNQKPEYNPLNWHGCNGEFEDIVSKFINVNEAWTQLEAVNILLGYQPNKPESILDYYQNELLAIIKGASGVSLKPLNPHKDRGQHEYAAIELVNFLLERKPSALNDNVAFDFILSCVEKNVPQKRLTSRESLTGNAMQNQRKAALVLNAVSREIALDPEAFIKPDGKIYQEKMALALLDQRDVYFKDFYISGKSGRQYPSSRYIQDQIREFINDSLLTNLPRYIQIECTDSPTIDINRCIENIHDASLKVLEAEDVKTIVTAVIETMGFKTTAE